MSADAGETRPAGEAGGGHHLVQLAAVAADRAAWHDLPVPVQLPGLCLPQAGHPRLRPAGQSRVPPGRSFQVSLNIPFGSWADSVNRFWVEAGSSTGTCRVTATACVGSACSSYSLDTVATGNRKASSISLLLPPIKQRL